MKTHYHIHIGMHKCGSTYLQEVFFKKFKKDFFVITNPLRTKKINFIIDDVIKKKITLIVAKKKLKNFVKNKKKIILSNESMISYHFDNFKYTAERFKIMEKLFNKPRYLIVYRNQCDFLYSLWLHRIRKGLKKDFREFINCKRINYNKEVKSHKYLTNYRIYDYNKIFYVYYKYCKKRTTFLDLQNFNNQKIFKNKIQKFLLTRKVYNNANNTNKINISRKYELIYFFCFMHFKLLNSIILNIIKQIYQILLFFNLIKISKYKHQHFNLISNRYFEIIEAIYFKNLKNNKINSFLNKIKKEKIKITKFYKKKNIVFYKKILNL